MARPATALFAEVEAGTLEVTLEDVILAEVFWTLHSFYGKSRDEALALVEPLVALPGVRNPEKEALFHALHCFATDVWISPMHWWRPKRSPREKTSCAHSIMTLTEYQE